MTRLGDDEVKMALTQLTKTIRPSRGRKGEARKREKDSPSARIKNLKLIFSSHSLALGTSSVPPRRHLKKVFASRIQVKLMQEV